MKRKVKAWAIISNDQDEVCGYMRRFEIHATKELAQTVIDTVEIDGLSIVPCEVSYTLPTKERKRKASK